MGPKKKISCELYLSFWGINRWVKTLISRTKNIMIIYPYIKIWKHEKVQ